MTRHAPGSESHSPGLRDHFVERSARHWLLLGVTEGLDALGRRLQAEVDAEEIQNETPLSDAWVQDWTGDAFGTGYSSLAHLRRFPVDALEIDRAFTSEIHEPEGRAIVRTIIGLGRILDLRVIAEGVETTEQADFLRREGCHALQGYWIGRPMESGIFEAWLRTWPGGQVARMATQLTVTEGRALR